MRYWLYQAFGVFVVAMGCWSLWSLARPAPELTSPPQSQQTRYLQRYQLTLKQVGSRPVAEVVTEKKALWVVTTERKATQAFFIADSPVGRLLVKSNNMAWPQTDQFFIRGIYPQEVEVLGSAYVELQLTDWVAEPVVWWEQLGIAAGMLVLGGAVVAYGQSQRQQRRRGAS